MKRVLLVVFTLFFICCTSVLAESSTYSLGTFEGDIGTNSNISHTVTVTKDGNLTYTVSGSGDLMPGGYPSSVNLYAANGTTVLQSIYFYQATSYRTQPGLAPGNYVLTVHTSNGSGHYTITTSFTNARDTVTETEPNDDKDHTQTLGDDPAYGTIGHTNKMPGDDLYYDHEDWLTVNVPGNGVLTITLSGDGNLMPGGYPSSVKLYAGDGTTSLGDKYFPDEDTDSITVSNVSQGTYYVLVYASQGYGSYTLYRTFTSAMDSPGETEANNLAENANPLFLDSTMTGVIGYRNYLSGNDLYWDHYDWFSVDVPADGRLEVACTGSTSLDPGGYPTTAILYAPDGTTQLSSTYLAEGDSGIIAADNLAQGTYNIAVYASQGYGAYSLTPSFTTALENPGETENNDLAANANILAGGPLSATLGYRTHVSTEHAAYRYDQYDWYRVDMPGDGRLTIGHKGAATLNPGGYPTAVRLYASNGTSLISEQYIATSEWGTIEKNGLSHGTYLVCVCASAGYGAYALTSSYEQALTSFNETEDNNSIGNADLIAIGTAISGTLGYSNRLPGDDPQFISDLNDWFAFQAEDGGTLTVTFSGEGNLWPGGYYAYVNLLDHNGTSLIASNYFGNGESVTLTKENTTEGVYYLQMYASGGGAYGTYNINTTFEIPNTPPEISGTPATQVDQDQDYLFQPTVTDPDQGASHTFAITNKPSWASFSEETGELSGTPGNADVGVYSNITITVTDNKGGSDQLPAFSITVNNVNDPPSISGTPATQVGEGSAYSFTPTASDPDGEDLTFGITNQPSWTQFDTATGRLWGTPEKADIGAYAGIVITASDALVSRSLPSFSITVSGASSVSGKVTLNIAGYEGLSVKNATITVEGTDYSTTTDADGAFALTGLPSGTYTLTVNAPDMKPATMVVNLTPGGAEILDDVAMQLETCSQEEIDQITEAARLEERQRWDANDDNQKGLPEAIDALQTVSSL